MHRFALGLLIILTVTGCNQDDSMAVSADDVAMVKGPDGTTQYMPVTHDAATSGYAQWLQLRADLAAIGSTGDFLDTQVGNLHLQRILLQRAQARHWKWAKLHGSGVVDLIAAQKTVQTRISQLDPNR